MVDQKGPLISVDGDDWIRQTEIISFGPYPTGNKHQPYGLKIYLRQGDINFYYYEYDDIDVRAAVIAELVEMFVVPGEGPYRTAPR